jgi:hypothetical protein
MSQSSALQSTPTSVTNNTSLNEYVTIPATRWFGTSLIYSKKLIIVGSPHKTHKKPAQN